MKSSASTARYLVENITNVFYFAAQPSAISDDWVKEKAHDETSRNVYGCKCNKELKSASVRAQ
jgi:hypothetical protein